MTTEAGGDVELFVSGGDARKLAPLVSDAAEFVPHLVLVGIALTARHLARGIVE